MENSFLYQVARHYFDSGDFRDKVFVLPNKRSLAFFRKHFFDFAGDKPFLLPRLVTINDFFARTSGRVPADSIKLLVTLYSCYSRLVKHPGTLDDFIGWGNVMVRDFDEVDKSLVDAAALFANAEDLRVLSSDKSWMTPEQKEALAKLAGHLDEDGREGRRDESGKGSVKDEFCSLWTILSPLYSSFREELAREGMAYEGMIYRDLADSVTGGDFHKSISDAYPGASCFVFIGLNALNACEKKVLDALKNSGAAEFCWDFCGPMLTDSGNDSSTHVGEYVKRYPAAFPISGGTRPKVRVVRVPSATGQAELVRPTLVEHGLDSSDALDYAVILPDRTLLPSVLPKLAGLEVNVNVTMGFPLTSSSFYMFMRNLMELQLHIRPDRDGMPAFHHKEVRDLLSDSIVAKVSGDEGLKVASAVRKAAKPYVPASDFSGCEIYEAMFRPLPDMDKASGTPGFAEYVSEMIHKVAGLLPDDSGLQLECARACDQVVRRLAGMELEILPATFVRLVTRLASVRTVPYEGEPLGGLQVMGPLETRALDFRHIILLSAGEGIFPASKPLDSVIPPELRFAFGMPTMRYRDAVWAYYFYRLLSRAETVTLIYDSRTDGNSTGEESRYIKQLRYLYGDCCDFSEEVAVPGMNTELVPDDEIPKTPDDVEIIRNSSLSASSIQSYIKCPAKFYFHTVRKLYKDDDVMDNLDAATLGTVCHDTLEALYCSEDELRSRADFDKMKSLKWEEKPHMTTITLDYLEKWLKPENTKVINDKILSLICHKMHCKEVGGRDVINARLALNYVLKVVSRDAEMVREKGPFTILGLEKEYDDIELPEFTGFKFKGYVDRVDRFTDGTVRIVDYKTGSDRQEILEWTTGPKNVAGKLFAEKTAVAYKAALQFYLYDKFVEHDDSFKECRKFNSMYAMNDLFCSGVSVNLADPDFMSEVDGLLRERLAEMTDLTKPFRKRPGIGDDCCKYCDYCMICGKHPKDNN